MRITIDNVDGQGAKDYTAAVAAEGPIKIHRGLNVPSRCTAEIISGSGGLPAPARRGRVVVANEAGNVLFTGYLATEPVPLYAGMGTTGAVYRLRLEAISDEWLLDKQGSGTSGVTNGLAIAVAATDLMEQLTQAAQTATTGNITLTTGGSARAVGAFAVQPAAGWSTNAAAAAAATYATYRVVNGTVSVASAGGVTHSFSEADGTLNLAELDVGHLRELANDVTVSGAEEPTAYVQEVFQGDGTTMEFTLSAAAFRGTNRSLLWDDFNAASIDTSQWLLSDGGSHLILTGAGLTFSGGNGLDGQILLKAQNAIEMSGFLLVELGGVVFGNASDGMLSGFYNGLPLLANCFAGFRVRQSVSATGSVTVVAAVMNGAETGTVFAPVAGHRYTLRLRLYCAEMQRMPQRYYCMVDGAIQEFGNVAGVEAPMQVVFEITDEGDSSNSPATVLFDSTAAAMTVDVSPAACTFVAVNSVNLVGSVASIEVTRPGSMWVVSTRSDGSQITRLIGAAAQGVDCQVEYGSSLGTAGKVTFFAGRIPAAQERITVQYRTERRAVARVADVLSVQAETVAGTGVLVPGVSRWIGKVIAPVARSSADCEAAAQAILAIATSRAAAQAGAFALCNPETDIWPGDLLELTTTGEKFSLLIRAVVIEDYQSVPEVLRYKVTFANDWATQWADGMGLRLSDEIATDATLPVNAESEAGQVLDNLRHAAITALSSTMVQIDIGTAPPMGGGFEVRRRDWVFGANADTPDLVLRSPVRQFSVPRSAQKEALYIRAYDGSTPPVYSRFSSALFLNWPVQ